jgi:hypothetical protein
VLGAGGRNSIAGSGARLDFGMRDSSAAGEIAPALIEAWRGLSQRRGLVGLFMACVMSIPILIRTIELAKNSSTVGGGDANNAAMSASIW